MTRRRQSSADPFKALADPTRRGILELLQRHEVRTAGDIAEHFTDISRPAVSRHLRVLREAGLVAAEGVGREQRYRLNPSSMARMHRDWFARFTPLIEASLSALKKQSESDAAHRRASDQNGRFTARARRRR